MSTTARPMVPLAELAAATGHPDIAAAAQARGYAVGVDPLTGMSAIGYADAAELAAQWRQAAEECSARNAELNAAADEWLRGRGRVYAEAYRAAHVDTPKGRAKAVQAAVKAAQAYERRCPAEIRDRVNLVYVDQQPRSFAEPTVVLGVPS